MFEPHAPSKTQVIVVGCKKHPEEMLKFIDVSTHLFGTHCEVCIVSSDNDLRQMKLERISDVYNRVTKLLKNQAEQFKALEHKIDTMSKEIKVTNVMFQPVMAKIDYMEKQSMTQLENLFRKLRTKFTKFNPFKNTKDEIETKLEDVNQKLDDLSYQDAQSLEALRNILKVEPRMKEDMKSFMALLKSKMENSKAVEMPSEREIGVMENAFEEFLEALTRSCEKFAHSAMK